MRTVSLVSLDSEAGVDNLIGLAYYNTNRSRHVSGHAVTMRNPAGFPFSGLYEHIFKKEQG